MAKLNAIVWPAIQDLAAAAIAEAGRKAKDQGSQQQEQQQHVQQIVVVEAAVLLEAKWTALVDEIWITEVPRETAIARIMTRNNFSEQVRSSANRKAKGKEQRQIASPWPGPVVNLFFFFFFTSTQRFSPLRFSIHAVAHAPVCVCNCVLRVKQEAAMRVNSQMSNEERRKAADAAAAACRARDGSVVPVRVLVNTGDVAALEAAAREVRPAVDSSL